MTWVARECAERARHLLGVSGPLPAETLCAAFRVPIYRWQFTGDVLGAYKGGAIGVRPFLPRTLREHIILHEMGHHFLEGPDADLHFWRRRDWVMWSKNERRAEEFAYHFALPGRELFRLAWCGVPTWDIAERYCRSDQWIEQRVLLAQDEPVMTPYWRQDWVA